MLLRSQTTTLGLLLLLGILPFCAVSQTTIINPANATGTSGANGSFENGTNTFAANNWTVVNGTTNKWFVGTQSFCTTAKGAYVSSHASGNNTNYNETTADVSHFYKDVTFPAGLSCITLTFSWKAAGESTFDGIHAYFGSTAVAPVGGTLYTTSDPSAVQVGATWYNQQTTCQTATIILPAAYAGTTKRLVFSWQNDGSIGTNPGGTIDNVSLVAQNPVIPTCATALVPANAATAVSPCNGLSWTAPAVTACNDATSYDVYFGTSATPPFLANTTATTYSPVMSYGTTYYWQIRPKNGAGTATGCAIQSFTTGTSSNPNYNLVDDATSAAPYDCVTLTPNLVSQRGCAWDANSTLNFLANFSYEMDVNLGSNDAGADGMAFVMQNDPLGRCKCGTVGGALGAGGIANSVTVEIDTYLNYEDRDDFTAPFIGCAGTEDPDHLDIWFNGAINPSLDANCDAVVAGERPATPNAVRLQSSPGVNYNIENGATHKFRIAWNAGTNTLTATVLNTALTVTYGTISATFNPVTVFGTSSPYFGFTGSTGGLTNQQTFCLPAVLLPVEFLSFEAACEGELSDIRWTTDSERDNDFFTIEKSCDGIHFVPMATVKGAGTSTEPHTYVVSDAEQCKGINYYRLSQTDMNGSTQQLAVRSVQSCETQDELVVYPNPATDQLNINWKGMSVESVVLFDAIGQRITGNESLAAHASGTTLDVSKLAAGVYYVTVYKLNETETVKLIID
jgi:hypothetical protein